MTVRNIDQNVVQMIRDLQEEVKILKSNVGSTRLNSIRLTNWVLEAVDDSLVKMTNLTTGEESYIGGIAEEADPVITYNEIVFSRSGLWNTMVADTSDGIPHWRAPSNLLIIGLEVTYKATSNVTIGVRVRSGNTTLGSETITPSSGAVTDEGYLLWSQFVEVRWDVVEGDPVWVEKIAQESEIHTVKDVAITLQWVEA